jgi:hypothetical protein
VKKRGIILILVGLAAWTYWLLVLSEIRRFPFSYEFGSVAFPIPTYLRVIGLFGICSILIGLALVAFDLAQWRRKKRNDAIH